jgi:hypothetical protein
MSPTFSKISRKAATVTYPVPCGSKVVKAFTIAGTFRTAPMNRDTITQKAAAGWGWGGEGEGRVRTTRAPRRAARGREEPHTHDLSPRRTHR